MAHINLLPWREEQRQHQKKQYLLGMVAVAAIVGLIFWFIGQAIDQQIKHQTARNTYLENFILFRLLRCSDRVNRRNQRTDTKSQVKFADCVIGIGVCNN